MIFPCNLGSKSYYSKLRGQDDLCHYLVSVLHKRAHALLVGVILVLYNLRPSSLQEVCHQYWPTGDTKGVQKFGEFNVSVLQATQQDGFIQRMLSVTNPKVRDGQICLQLHY